MPFKFSDPSRSLYRSGCLFLGLDQHGREVGIETEKHAITVASARTGKGAAVIIQNLLRWPDNVLCIDPAGENVAATWEAIEARGVKVVLLDPFHEAKVPARLRASCDLLGAIDPTGLMAREQFLALGDGCVLKHKAEDAEWYEAAVAMIAGAAAYVRTAPEWKGPRDLLSVREMLSMPDDALRAIFERMTVSQSAGGLARDAGVMGLTGLRSDKGLERGGITGARKSTAWIGADAMQEVLAASSFSLSELKTGNVAVFLVLPIDMISDYARFLRLFVRCALSAMQRGGKQGRKCLFLLDEFYALGRLDAISTAIGALPKNGVHIWPFLQDINQLIDLYGPYLSHTFFENSDVEMFFAATGAPTLEYISSRLGTLTQTEVVDVPPRTDYTRTAYVQKDHSQMRAAIQRDPQLKGLFGGHVDRGWFEEEKDYLSRISVEDENERRQIAAEDENKRRKGDAEDENRRRHQATEDENARRHQATEDENRRRLYEHQMRSVGRPRLTPLEIKDLTAKRDGDKVARSMIVFGKGDDVFNLRLLPYFINAQSNKISPEPWWLLMPLTDADCIMRDYYIGKYKNADYYAHPWLRSDIIERLQLIGISPDHFSSWNLDNMLSEKQRSAIDDEIFRAFSYLQEIKGLISYGDDDGAEHIMNSYDAVCLRLRTRYFS